MGTRECRRIPTRRWIRHLLMPVVGKVCGQLVEKFVDQCEILLGRCPSDTNFRAHDHDHSPLLVRFAGFTRRLRRQEDFTTIVPPSRNLAISIKLLADRALPKHPRTLRRVGSHLFHHERVHVQRGSTPSSPTPSHCARSWTSLATEL